MVALVGSLQSQGGTTGDKKELAKQIDEDCWWREEECLFWDQEEGLE